MKQRTRECLWFAAEMVLVTLFALACLWMLSALLSCSGPYRGPDAVPDEVYVGYGWGASEYGFEPLSGFSATEDAERWTVGLTWHLSPPALPGETDARRNELLEQLVDAGETAPASADDSVGTFERILSAIQTNWLAFVFLCFGLALVPFLRKRMMPQAQE